MVPIAGCPTTWRDSIRRWLVYTAGLPGSQSVVVVNGRPSALYDGRVFEPRVSRNRQHVGYVMQRGDMKIVVVDGEEQLRHPGIATMFKGNGPVQMSWFDVLDDGRSLVFAEEASGKIRAFLGGEPLEPAYDGVLRDGVSQSPDGKHYMFKARVGSRWRYVLDGEVLEHPGVAGRVAWSKEGDEYAFVVMHARVIPAPGEPSEPAEGYVLNGTFVPHAHTSGINHQRGYWLVTTRDPHSITILGLPTPSKSPTDDEYVPAGSRAASAIRVRIGDSLGPVFDSIEPREITITDGQVRYRGKRGNDTLDVVNNVIVRPDKPVVVEKRREDEGALQVAE